MLSPDVCQYTALVRALGKCHNWLACGDKVKNLWWVDDGSSQSSIEVSPACDCRDSCQTRPNMKLNFKPMLRQSLFV